MPTRDVDHDTDRPEPVRPDSDRAWNRGMRNSVWEALFGIDNDEEGRLAEGEYLAANMVIELKGNARFEPHDSVAYYIQNAGDAGVSFPAQFDKVAQGQIVIYWDGCAFQSDRYWALPINAKELRSRNARTVALLVYLEGNEFRGLISTIGGFAMGAGLEIYVGEQDHDLEELSSVLFGRSYHGPESLDANWKNWLESGELWFVCDFHLRPPDGPAVEGLFSFLDGDYRFMADSHIAAEGAESHEVEVRRTPSGILHATPRIKVGESWEAHGVKGDFEVSFFDGSFESRGRIKIKYPDEKGKKPFVEGELTVVVTTEDKAWALARANDPNPDLTGGLTPYSPSGGGLALVAWGGLDLKLADAPKGYPNMPALTAKATFIVDPAGDLTARGILRLPRYYELLPPKRFGGDPLVDFSVTEGANIYGPFGGEVTAYAKAVPFASIGPFSLRDLVAEGTYSTRPGVGTQIKLAAAFNASAEASVEAKAGVKLAATVGLNKPSWLDWVPIDTTWDIGSIDLGLKGTAVIRGYAEARPEIKIDKPPADVAESPPEYSIHGSLEVAGEVVLKLEAGLSASLGPWSKSGGVGTEYTLGRGGVSIEIDHVFGSSEHPKPKFSFTGFDKKKFVKDMLLRTPRPARGDRFKGKFKEEKKGARAVDAIEGEAPPVPPLPPRPFDLHVPFTIRGKPHQLVLNIEPDNKSRLELVRSPGERVAIRPKAGIIGEALEHAEHMFQGATTTEDQVFFQRQVNRLSELFEDAVALEAEANRFAPDVESLEAEDITDMDDYAMEVIEYAELFGDYTLEGHGRLLAAPFEDPGVGLLGPERFDVLGATRYGDSREFIGNFDDPKWNWDDWPQGPITQHPINKELGLRVASDLSELRPADDYHFVPNLKTPGADAIKPQLENRWRGPRKKEANLLTEKLFADRGYVNKQQARWDAEASIAYDWAAMGYPHHRFDVLLVWKHTGWFCHHIHEFSWGQNLGSDVDHEDNLIYLAKEEHERITKWFVAREKHINKQLDIYEQKKKP